MFDASHDFVVIFAHGEGFRHHVLQGRVFLNHIREHFFVPVKRGNGGVEALGGTSGGYGTLACALQHFYAFK